jgi:acyl-CoA thioester hydrolase
MTDARLLVHTSPQRIRWGDMDAFGHVNNTVYFRYMEQARLEWLYALAAKHGAHDPSEGPVIANATCDFLAPLVYPADLEVRMFVGEPGRTSIGTFYEIWADGRKYAEGASRLVWIDRTTGRSTPLPEAIAASLRSDLEQKR